MRRIMAVLAVTTAAILAPAAVGLNAQASPATTHSNGHDQVVRDPSGRLVATHQSTPTSGQQKAKKAPPPAVSSTTGTGTGCTSYAVNLFYCRAGAAQAITSDGAYMSTPVQSPTVTANDNHSLAELAVQSADGRQIIEIGWRIYRPEGPTPRLFVYHWINGQGTCYNTDCPGYVQSSSTTITPHMALTASSTPVQFAIEYFQGNWWYGYNGTWFGYLPGSLWGGSFTKAGLVQIFGEVSSTVARPCTNMGNGIIGTNASAAAVTGVGYYNGATATNLSRGSVDDSTLYDSQVTSATSFRYGGPGAC
jgi:hypothetical protein